MNNKFSIQILRIFFTSLCLLFFTPNLLLSQSSYSFEFQQKSYEQIFKEIEEKTGNKFVYNTQEINPQEKVSITISNKQLSNW